MAKLLKHADGHFILNEIVMGNEKKNTKTRRTQETLSGA